jgi:hypothetical protein
MASPSPITFLITGLHCNHLMGGALTKVGSA